MCKILSQVRALRKNVFWELSSVAYALRVGTREYNKVIGLVIMRDRRVKALENRIGTNIIC